MSKRLLWKLLKKDRESKHEINIETYFKKKKIKKENMEETTTIIRLKKRNNK